MSENFDYMDKIKKLLRLAEKAGTEHEAKNALMMARQLMAKYKIDQSDVDAAMKPVDEKVVHLKSSVNFSKRRDPWISDLADIIAENFCCKSAVRHVRGSHTYFCIFIGFETDAAVANAALEYAVNFVQYHINEEIVKPMMKEFGIDYRSRYISSVANGYGFGFAKGLLDNFREQYRQKSQEDQNWGLVMVTPQAVIDNVQQTCKSTFNSASAARDNMSYTQYSRGYADGKQFDVNRRQISE